MGLDKNIEKGLEKEIEDLEDNTLAVIQKVFRSEQFRQHFEFVNEKDLLLGFTLGIYLENFAGMFGTLNKEYTMDDFDEFWVKIFDENKKIKKKIDKAS